MSCAVFWTSTRGEADEQLRELDFAGTSADAWLDLVALPLAGGGTGGSVFRGGSGLPERGGALPAGRGAGGPRGGGSRQHIHVGCGADPSGRSGRGRVR